MLLRELLEAEVADWRDGPWAPPGWVGEVRGERCCTCRLLAAAAAAAAALALATVLAAALICGVSGVGEAQQSAAASLLPLVWWEVQQTH